MNTTARFSTSTHWLQTMKQEGFYFRPVGIFVIVIGFYLHLTRLFVGDTILIGYILTPLFDQLFAIQMTFAGIAGILSWKRMEFRSNSHKAFVRFSVIYITVSIPLHTCHILYPVHRIYADIPHLAECSVFALFHCCHNRTASPAL